MLAPHLLLVHLGNNSSTSTSNQSSVLGLAPVKGPRARTAESAGHHIPFGKVSRLSIANKAVGTPGTIWSVDVRQSKNQLACLFPVTVLE